MNIFSKYNLRNIYLKRIFSIKKSIFFYSISSFIDISALLLISRTFKKITVSSGLQSIYIDIILCFLLIILRTYIVVLLKEKSFNHIFHKKFCDENFIIKNFIDNKKYEFVENTSLNIFKEKIINSTNLAALYFDIPITSIVAEVIFAIGGFIILINIFGLNLFIFNLPIVFIFGIFSRFISRELKNLGFKIIKYTEKRLNSIENIGEIAIELSVLNNTKKLNNYFKSVNKEFNQTLSKQIIKTNSLQIFTESTAYIIVLITLITQIAKLTNASLADSATSLAILSKLVPSFTRSISFITQLQFGIPSVRRLSEITENNKTK